VTLDALWYILNNCFCVRKYEVKFLGHFLKNEFLEIILVAPFFLALTINWIIIDRIEQVE